MRKHGSKGRVVPALIITLSAFAAFSAAAQEGPVLAGSHDGLFSLDAEGRATALWTGGEVRKIMRSSRGWYLLSGAGVVHSPDLKAFIPMNAGIPVKTLKTLDEAGKKGFLTEVQDLKDLEFHPDDDSIMVSCSKDDVFLSRDGGKAWRVFPSPNSTTGLKAAVVYSNPRLTIIVSHPIKGLYRLQPDDAKPAWVQMNEGLPRIPGTSSVEEIADLRAVREAAGPALYASGSFLPRIYRWDGAAGIFRTVYDSGKDFGMVDSLQPLSGGMAFVIEESVGQIALPAAASSSAQKAHAPLLSAMSAYRSATAALASRLEALAFTSPGGQPLSFSELWLVDRRYATPRIETARGKDGLYLVTGFARTKMDFYADLMKKQSLDMLTIDMKDDFGYLRFTPRSELLKKMGKPVSPLDIEPFVAKMKEQGVYLVARIVVFKDERIHELEGGKYAVWDAREKKPWRGYFRGAAKPAPSPTLPPTAGIPGAGASAAPAASPEPELEYSAEYWVDPYSEVVWRYNVEIAKEIIARGFDEVQFDYIRFPTDGVNLDDASYRWRDSGMDKESALMSFLKYARESIDAPISIDIYGANGWYRTGVRTGQDVEMLQRYADVICPMFYPSHFEQDFYDMHPAEERPWRIYYYGSLRNTYIARYRAIVRPWVQAFYMNVRYDRKYYDREYIKREVRGVRESVDMGMTFWNNSGKYQDLPDMADPALGGGKYRVAEKPLLKGPGID